MQTDDLIQSLSTQLKPVGRGAVAGLGSAAIMLVWVGPRPALAHALATALFGVKSAYAARAGLILALATGRLSRPGARLGGLAVAIALPFLLMGAMGAMRLAMA